jgi:hypothetical protein
VKRTIKLKCIKDPHIVEFVDGGITKEGEASSQRQALQRVLAKRVGVVVDGKETQLPIFLIESVGDWRFAPNEAPPAGDEAQAFEEDVIRREHPEHMLAKWAKAREQFISKAIETRRLAEHQYEQQMGGEVAKSIQAMVKSVASSANKAVARV